MNSNAEALISSMPNMAFLVIYYYPKLKVSKNKWVVFYFNLIIFYLGFANNWLWHEYKSELLVSIHVIGMLFLLFAVLGFFAGKIKCCLALSLGFIASHLALNQASSYIGIFINLISNAFILYSMKPYRKNRYLSHK